MRQGNAAARNSAAFLREAQEGDNANYAYRRLVAWDCIKPQGRTY